MNGIKTKFMNLKLGTKFMLYYLILFLFAITMSDFIYMKINSKIMSDKISNISIQTLQSINLNIELLIDTANDYSKTILSNEVTQKTLRNSNTHINWNRTSQLYKYFYSLMNSTPVISSIYLFDYNGHVYSTNKSRIVSPKIQDFTKTPWYNEVLKKNGSYILRLNGADLFFPTDKNYISLIRIVNDLNTQKPIGLLIINISQDSFIKAYKGIDIKDKTIIRIQDENNQDLVKSQDINRYDLTNFLESSKTKSHYSILEKINNKDYLISSINNDKYTWKLISIIPFDEISKEQSILTFIGIIILVLNSLLLFFGSLTISKLITVPIDKLVESLKDIEKGMFHPVEINCGNDEIGKLRDAYNIMIKEIDRLIKRVIKEQKIKRKTELNILQEQIKPHFLYNTFDAISALILLEKNKEAYTMIKALGNFYKTSLSSGKEIIPINEEIKTVENYLTILKMRYKDIFTTEFHIDNEIVHYKIPKLILQPFVENAVYHGIKPKGETGIISITACQKENFILFIIEDTGVGMDEEVLQQISIQDDTKTTAHFGIRGTIERLKIFYGVKDVFSIESKKTIGTKVTLTIPIKGESEYV